MSILRALAINSLLSLVFIFCLLSCTHTEFLRSTTTTTRKPFVRSPGLSLPSRNSHPPKCKTEVPAVFFKHEKDEIVVGNASDKNFFEIDVCCKGFKRYDFEWSRCVPDCGNKCQRNGFCLEGGICQCFPDFIMNHRNECIPTCPLGCPHGQCYLNGTCICNRGYELHPSKKYCVPLCEQKTCGHNEFCNEPNKCICKEGYAKQLPHLEMGCQPICVPDCGYGHCVAPNECECFRNYQKRTNGTSCESDCYMRCENGFCANRTSCICQDGYKFDNVTTSCLPDCGDNCENGVCISPGVCRCFNGYKREGLKCKAICELGCGFYGKCIAPDKCGCALVDGPFKTYRHCFNGHCGAEGQCVCNPGFTRFINQCLLPDQVTAYATTGVNASQNLAAEFRLLLGQHFGYAIEWMNSPYYSAEGYLRYNQYSYS